MKYLVFSDLHGSEKGLWLLKEAIEKQRPEALICLGDILYGAYDGAAKSCADFLSNLTLPILGVRGNCDFSSDEIALGFSLPPFRTFCYDGHTFHLAHVQPYGLFQKGDVVLFGHSHRKTLHEEGDVFYLNPGSIGKPRDGAYGYAIIEGKHLALFDAETHEELSSLTLE